MGGPLLRRIISSGLRRWSVGVTLGGVRGVLDCYFVSAKILMCIMESAYQMAGRSSKSRIGFGNRMNPGALKALINKLKP